MEGPNLIPFAAGRWVEKCKLLYGRAELGILDTSNTRNKSVSIGVFSEDQEVYNLP